VDHAAIDLGKFHSQIAILAESGELEERRIRTERHELDRIFGGRARMRVLVESSTGSEWVARHVEGLGHEVVVADPNYAPMYGQRNRRIKTDRRDARALVEAIRLGAYRPAHRTSDRQRMIRVSLRVRDVMVRSRTRLIGAVESALRADGLRLRTGSSSTFADRVRQAAIPAALLTALEPLLGTIDQLTDQIRSADRELRAAVQRDPLLRRLTTTPGVGPVTATAFVAALDDISRFSGGHQVAAYLGLVPREDSSGEKQHRGRITKAGNSHVRWLLVEAAWHVMTRKRPEAAPLWEWAMRITHRRGRYIAVVALARKLAGLLFAMWRDGSTYAARRSQDVAA